MRKLAAEEAAAAFTKDRSAGVHPSPAQPQGRGESPPLSPRRPRKAAAAVAAGRGEVEVGPSPTSPRHDQLLHLPLDQVVPSPDNPRKRFDDDALEELAESLRQVGVLEPIVVREHGNGLYELVAGERRWRAARLAGLPTIPAVLFEAGGARAAAQARLVENVQRQDLTAIEIADALQALIEDGLTQAQAGEAIGLKGGQSRVSHMLKLRSLPEGVRARLTDGTFSAAHGEALLKWAAFPAFLEAVADLAVRHGLAARELAAPFEHDIFDLADDDVDYDDVFVHVGYAVVEAACKQCPFGAFVRSGDQYSYGYCLRPAHVAEVEAQLEQQRKDLGATQRAHQGERLEEARALVRETTLHAAPHTAKPGLADYHALPYDAVELLKWRQPVPAPCAAGTCPCWGEVRYGDAVEPVCTEPATFTALRARLTKARAVEDARRQALALAQLEAKLAQVENLTAREAVVLLTAVLNPGGYRPSGTHVADSWRVAAQALASTTDAMLEKTLVSDADAWLALARSERPYDLVRAMVAAVCRADILMRFHHDGGASYGHVAEWYVGAPLPERTPADWQPDA